MSELVSFNGDVVAAGDAGIGATSGAAFSGNGIFTTIAIFDGEPFVWEKHWRRLSDNCDRVGLDRAGLTESEMSAALTELIARNGVRDGRARITIFDETSSAFWTHETQKRTSVLMVTASRRPPSRPFRLGISPHRTNSTSPLSGIKSCNYLDKHLARSEASGRGFDEAVQMNERGEVGSACMANLFWTNAGRLFTPSLKTGCLAGTTREHIMETLECLEVEAGIEALETADDIFLTSAGVGILQVDEFNGRSLQLKRHSIMNLLL